jgi:hypothetical protein
VPDELGVPTGVANTLLGDVVVDGDEGEDIADADEVVSASAL